MSAKTENLMALAESLVAYGRKKGAGEIEVSINEGSQFSVNVREGNVERLTEAGNKGLNLRLFVDGKQATASSSDLSEATLARMIDNAIERAKLAGADQFAGLPDPAPIKASAESLKIYDPAILTLSPEKKIAAATKVEAIGLADKRIKKSAGSTFGTFVGTRYLANSKGFSGSSRKSFNWCGVGFQCGEGDNLLQDGWYETRTSVATLPTPEEIAKKAVLRVTRLIGARKVPTQDVPIVLEPQMTAGLLGFLAQCIGGGAIDQKQSFLVDKLGQKIAVDLVTIVDDGLLPGAQGSSPFDSEGVPSRTTTVVDKGTLKSYLLNTYYGRKLKLASTGNAGGPTNLYMAKGTSTPAEIIKSVDKGLYLTGTIGLGRVPTTGDLSVGAFGLWIEKGELTFPVAEITISGNLGELLQGVQMVGNDLELNDTIAGPTIKIAKISVGGTGAAKG
jgi:PmbA protein